MSGVSMGSGTMGSGSMTGGATTGGTMTGGTEDPRIAFGDAVLQAALRDPRVVVLSADSGGSSGFRPFAKRLPDRYLELGIQEHGVTGVAAGLATMGKVPVFCAIAPFVTCRNFEAFRNDLGYMRQNVKIVGRNGGYTYSDLGATHHSLEDYAIMRMIPGVTVLSPQDPGEIRGAVAAMLDHDGPVYLRLGSEPMRTLFADGEDFAIGRARQLSAGTDLTVLTTGHVAAQVADAVDVLTAEGISIDLLCLGTVWPLDEPAIRASARRTGRVVTIEEHYVHGGLGGAVCELLADQPVVVHRIGVPHEYVTTGPYAEVRASLGLDRDALAHRLRALAR